MHRHLKALLTDLSSLPPARRRWIVDIWTDAYTIHGSLTTHGVRHDTKQAVRFLAKARTLL